MEQWWKPYTAPDGLILREQVLTEGVDPDHLVVALRTGRMYRVQRGVYCARAHPPTALGRARAAVLSSGVLDAVASHQTAARVHDLAVPDRPAAEHVTVRREQRRIRRRDLHFHSRALALGDVELVGGVQLTSVARTVFDLCATLPRREAVWCVDDALRRGLLTRAQLRATVEVRRGGPGEARAAERIGQADGLAESILETASRLALADAQVPLPVAQLEVHDADGRLIGRLDGGYPQLRLGLELDGRSVHSAPEAILRDRFRQNALEAAGWRVLRFTWWTWCTTPSASSTPSVGRWPAPAPEHRAAARPGETRVSGLVVVADPAARSGWYLQTPHLPWGP
ncbi:hypothetical protein [Rhodococcus sp. X156]|uniref:hypothetical protein n=1 Tax=Rhodococcus sp. X156 TaxID=2499145 RepID=UPI000FD6CEE4|nr:hypothetical protein [Rhodococcus sp. X156]